MEALQYPATQLFMERAAASGYGAALSDTDAPIVARSCRRLDRQWIVGLVRKPTFMPDFDLDRTPLATYGPPCMMMFAEPPK